MRPRFVPSLVAGVDVRTLPLTAMEGFVLSRIDGRTSADEIAVLVGLGREMVDEVLIRLRDLGAITLPATGEATPTNDERSTREMFSIPAPSATKPPTIGTAASHTIPAPPGETRATGTMTRPPPATTATTPPASGGAVTRPPANIPPALTSPPHSGPLLSQANTSPPGAGVTTPPNAARPSGVATPAATAPPAAAGFVDRERVTSLVETPPPTAAATAPPIPGDPLTDRSKPPSSPSAENVDLPPDMRRDVTILYARLEDMNLYEVLGLKRDAERAAIRDSYFRLSKKFHPDSYFRKELGTYKSKMEAIFTKLTEAYETLGKKQARASYDEYLGLVTQTETAARQLHEGEEEANRITRERDSQPPAAITKELVAPPPPRISVVPSPAAPSSSAAPSKPASEPAAAKPASGPAPATSSGAPAAGTPPPASRPQSSPAATPARATSMTPSPTGATAPPASSTSSPKHIATQPASGTSSPTHAAATRSGTSSPQHPATPATPATPAPAGRPESKPAPRSPSGRPLRSSGYAPAPPPGRVSRHPTASGAPSPQVPAAPKLPDDPEAARKRRAQELLARRMQSSGMKTEGLAQPEQRMRASDRARDIVRTLRETERHTGGADPVMRHLAHAKASELAGNNIEAANALRLAAAIAPERIDIQTEYERVRRLVAASLAETFEKQAKYEEENGKHAAAAASWAKVFEGRPQDANAAHRAAHNLLKIQGDLHTARSLAQSAVALSPSAPNHRLLAQVFIAANLKLNAKRELEAAAKLDPKDELVKNLLRDLK